MFIYLQLGERKSGIHTNTGKVQDFYEIRDKCLRDGKLFEDDSFPADDSSFYLSPGKNRRAFKWVRPSELVNKPMFISEGEYNCIAFRDTYLSDSLIDFK